MHNGINSEGSLVQGLHELFKYTFITNCLLDNDSVTLEESNTIDTFEPIELLENFKDLILNLLNFKKKFKSHELSDIEMLMKKHEEELKYHILYEQELKSQLETSKIREEDLLNNYELAVTRLKEVENFKFSQQKSEDFRKWEQAKQELYEKIYELSLKADMRDSITANLEYENQKLKSLLEEKFIQVEMLKSSKSKKSILRKDIKNASNIDVTKKIVEEKANELISHQQKLRERISSKTPLKDSNRKPYGAPDYSKLNLSSHQGKLSRGHTRSSSSNLSL